MVKIGDKIITESGDKGRIVDIARAADGRYFIFYDSKRRKVTDVFLEGDVGFRVVK